VRQINKKKGRVGLRATYDKKANKQRKERQNEKEEEKRSEEWCVYC